MNRFIEKYVLPLGNVSNKNGTVDTTERKRDRTTTGYTVQSRYKECLGEEALRRRILRSSKSLLSELRKVYETSKSSESKRSETKRQTTASKLRLYLPILFYSIIYNPHFWQFLLIIDTSFTDELISYSAYNLSVIHNTTQSLIGRGGIIE